ncbi:PREDICTED: pentatricopeptide repeat-containing protein At3g02490, mitochondrial-like [Populus euphratica]|uniref:Pentatricopeptide repeat-containing protein At3g02490, mitochondrial-like n=1 Tax=Populus euphratica TaxID=75702 RepID=A0AAJ6TJW8_POPEU|nr:PREDICTED: pentatricopeptide repeat-containing protein At3g02490, mitochondrial-like [Populus euphratica]XP_011012717.1 PREDICTED: pentatricopeptide repeat-containing protein At3g02490, mitochondrial-like [Populus euphratica]
MRHSWRVLLYRKYPLSSLKISNHFQVLQQHSPSLLRSLSPSLHTLALQNSHFSETLQKPNIYNKTPLFARNFSSEASLVEPTKDPDHVLLVCDAFTKFDEFDEISKELELNSVVISHDLVLKVLKSLEPKPEVAKRFFDWVLEKDSGRLISKSYNWMLEILGVNGLVVEFWDLVDKMKIKGHGMSGVTRDRVQEKFEKEGLNDDLEKLKGVFARGSVDNSVEKIGLRVSRIVRNKVWGGDVEGEIKHLCAEFSSDLVKIVLEHLVMEPVKALIFFRWIEDSELCKHDGRSYNAMARVLGREDCIDRFWKVIDEMRSNGFEMERGTFDTVLARFMSRKMIKEAIDLYEFAMTGANKPSAKCCTYLLRKIVVGKQLDMGLFSRVVEIFTGHGNVLTDPMLDAVLKALTNVGKFGECNKVLREMKVAGFVASGNLQRKIAFGLTSAGKNDEANEFVNHMESSGRDLSYKAWASLIEGHCVSGDLEKASDCFKIMVEKKGVSGAGYAIELLVNAYCRKNRAMDACNLLCDYVCHNHLCPWQTTYKVLISKLLVQGVFKDALNLLGLMQSHGIPPHIDPFFEFISKSGTGDDAIAFMNAMTTKKFPSISVALRMFKAFFKAKRHGEAQDFLSKCPIYIRNRADVLNLFCSKKFSNDTAATDVSV